MPEFFKTLSNQTQRKLHLSCPETEQNVLESGYYGLQITCRFFVSQAAPGILKLEFDLQKSDSRLAHI